jgi:hypothetical protein
MSIEIKPKDLYRKKIFKSDYILNESKNIQDKELNLQDINIILTNSTGIENTLIVGLTGSANVYSPPAPPNNSNVPEIDVQLQTAPAFHAAFYDSVTMENYFTISKNTDNINEGIPLLIKLQGTPGTISISHDSSYSLSGLNSQVTIPESGYIDISFTINNINVVPGDYNEDGSVNILDIVGVINEILYGGADQTTQGYSNVSMLAPLFGNNLNILHIVAIINIILNN